MHVALHTWRRLAVGILALCLANVPAVAQPAASAHPLVVFLGDSITGNWSDYRPKFFAENGYVTRGISGEQSAGMLQRFRRDVVDLKPAAVFILAGANDVSGWGGQVTDEKVIDNLKAMVELARSNKIKVAIGSVTPSPPYAWNPNEKPGQRIPALDMKIKAWADAEGIAYADFYPAMAAPNGEMNPLYGDHHPKRAGYAVMEPIAKAAIDKALAAQR